jgi:hypothetical protein
MAYLGSWKIDDLLTFPANTHRFDTGNATDADSVATYRIYEDETSTPILTGSMALLDSANTAGFYSEQITLSAANGFEKGKSYTIYISATVNSVTGTMSHTFQMEAEVDANRLNWANIDGPTTTVSLSGTTIAWNASWDAEVQSEVVDALTVDTYAEVSAVPAATSSLKDKINWLFSLARNKITQTATTSTLRNDADSGNISTSTVADDGTTATRGEWS